MSSTPRSTHDRLAFATLALLVSGILLVLGAGSVGIAMLDDLGVICVGTGLLLAGVETILRRQLFWNRPSATDATGAADAADAAEVTGGRGLSAVCWGLLFSEVGALLVLAGIANLVSPAEPVRLLLQTRPGLPLALAGVALCFVGAAAIFDQPAARSTLRTGWRFCGGPTLLVGALLVVVGFVAAPESITAWLPAWLIVPT